MVLFTTSVNTQNTAGQAGVSGLPQIGSIKQYTVISDEFARLTLNPTNAVAVYVAYAASSGTVNMTANAAQLLTANAQNDYEGLKLSEIGISRATQFIDQRTQVTFDVIFDFGSTTNETAFIGLIASNANLTTLPTTTTHLGLYLDTSVSNNFKLSSADGSTQTTTDTSNAVDTSKYRLNISWTGNNSAVISLYSSTSNYSTLIKSQTVTSILSNNEGALYYQNWIQAITAAPGGAKSLLIQEWKCSAL